LIAYQLLGIIETMKALQGLGKQAWAKVSIQEGSVISK
tara:strand:+ start:37 stop:150 length:114 start_codon:yes stop_codon:yes gene_type:complete